MSCLHHIKCHLLVCICFGIVSFFSLVYADDTSEKWPSNKICHFEKFIDHKKQGLSSDSSGITYQKTKSNETGHLWIVKNSPSKLFKMELDNNTCEYANVNSGGWGCGKKKGGCGKELKYKHEEGNPDTEGVTFASWENNFVFVASEGKKRLKVLRFDVRDSTDKILSATHEWDLTDDILKDFKGTIKTNKGLEAITWIPDESLTKSKFWNSDCDCVYNPDKYDSHYGGLFLVGLERNIENKNNSTYIYIFALMEDGSHKRIARIDTGWNVVVGLEYDRDNDLLWANCDNDCTIKNQLKVFKIITNANNQNTFEIFKTYEPPKKLDKKRNYEGIAFYPQSLCQSGTNNFFWVDDGGKDGQVIAQHTFQCH